MKITKTDLFKEQEKMLPKEIKKMLPKIIKTISKDPKNASNTMNIFGEPSAKELKQWASEVESWKIDLILEYLFDKKCLNKKGKLLQHEFWEEFVKEK